MRVSRNKNSLKQQRDQLAMYRKFLPSLDLKRQQLLVAWKAARDELAQIETERAQAETDLSGMMSLLGSSTLESHDLTQLLKIKRIEVVDENIVGTRVPKLNFVEFERAEYSTLALPFWVDLVLDAMESISTFRLKVSIAQKRERRLAEAARKITQRVNLFEKVLIPNALENIKVIGVALSDEERSAVVRSKLAKQKHSR